MGLNFGPNYDKLPLLMSPTNLKSKPSTEELQAIAKRVRRHIITQTHCATNGHPGGSLSVTEILVALYFHAARFDPKNPSWPDRDRVILSKGHACPALYAVMAEAGYFDVSLLKTFRKIGSPLQGHPDRRKLPGIEASTGSLGQGLSIAIGHALAANLDKKDYITYCVISDGESNEGQIWEAAMMAGHRKMNNIIAILDANKYQLDDSTKSICDMEPFADKWKAFHWEVKEIDGHNMQQVVDALDWAKTVKNKPVMIVAHTVKGKGVSFMENNNGFHGVAPNDDECKLAMKELE